MGKEDSKIGHDEKAKVIFEILNDGYGYGNYRFNMGDFEMSTSGGHEDDYKEDEEVPITVYADGQNVFTATFVNGKFKALNVINQNLFLSIYNKIINGKFKIIED